MVKALGMLCIAVMCAVWTPIFMGNDYENEYSDIIYENSGMSELYEHDEYAFEPIGENFIEAASSQIRIHSGQRLSTALWERGGGTVGAKAICNRTGLGGIITNEHVAPSGAAIHLGWPWITGTRVGTRVQAWIGGRVDAAFIPFGDRSMWAVGSSASYRRSGQSDRIVPHTYIVADRHGIVEGLPVVMFGAESGRREGIITNIGRNTNIRGIEFTDQISTNIRGAPGDSGAPLFAMSQGRYILVGMVMGGSTYAIANKITNVIEALDVTIVAEGQPLQKLDLLTYHFDLRDGDAQVFLQGENAPFFDARVYCGRQGWTNFSFSISGGNAQILSTNWPAMNFVFRTRNVTISFMHHAFRIYSDGVLSGIVTRPGGHQFSDLIIEVTRMPSPAAPQSVIIGNPTSVTHWQHITNHMHFDGIRENPGGNFRILNNITIPAGIEWRPIPYLTGRLDGRNFTISNLNITQAGQLAPVGLFAVNNGRIENLVMANANINLGYANLYNRVGTVTGVNHPRGVINNVTVRDSHIDVLRWQSQIGGVVGVNHGQVLQSRFERGSIRASGDLGGIAGSNGSYQGSVGLLEDVTVTEAHIMHHLIHMSHSTGGIVGANINGTIRRPVIFIVNIRNVGIHNAWHVSPPMGVIAGTFMSSRLENVVYAQSIVLDRGHLGNNQLIYFGASIIWPWGGRVVGVNVIIPAPVLPTLFNEDGTINPTVAAGIVGALNANNTAAVDRMTEFRLFPDTGSGHVLALSRLMWRVVHVDGDRVTLWAAGAYRNSQFHLAGDIPVYLKSHLRQNLLSDFTGLGLLNHIQLHSVCSGVYDHIWVPTLAEVNGWDLTVAQRSFDPNGFWQNAWLRSHQGTQFPNNAHIILGQAGVASSAHGILWCAVRPALHLSLGALVAA